jgi:hypothetical protein
MNGNTPGDYVGYGLLVAVVGGVIAALAAAVTGTNALLWLTVPPAVVAAFMIQIGVIAWGVRVGMNAARADAQSARR